MLRASDLADLAGAIADQTEAGLDSLKWMEREDISRQAMTLMLDSSGRQFRRMVEMDGDVLGALHDQVGQAFRLGWEAAKVFKSETGTGVS